MEHVIDNVFTNSLKKSFIDRRNGADKMPMAKLALLFVHRSSRQSSFLDKCWKTSFDSVISKTPSGSSSSSTALTSTQRRLAINGLVLDINNAMPWLDRYFSRGMSERSCRLHVCGRWNTRLDKRLYQIPLEVFCRATVPTKCRWPKWFFSLCIGHV